MRADGLPDHQNCMNNKTVTSPTALRRRFSLAVASLALVLADSVLTMSVQGGLYAPAAPGAALFVTNQPVNQVVVFPSGGGSSVLVTGPTAFPGIAFDTAGNLYIANTLSNVIQKFTPGGGGSIFATTGLNNPTGLAFDSAGNLFVSNYGNDTIWKYNSIGVGSLFTGTGLNKPNGLAFDNAGNLYAANVNNTIAKFTAGAVYSTFASTGLNIPVGLAFDSANNLFVSNVAGNSIVKFNPGGIGTVFASNVPTPVGLAFDNNGDLYVGENTNNLVEKFNPLNASHSLFADCGLAGTANLAFSPYSLIAVPEPATFVAGFLCLGVAVVRRRRTSAVA